MNLITESGTMTTTIVANEDKNKVFEICRDCSDGECAEWEEVVLLTLYPTTNEVQRFDLSTMHMVNHLEELGLKKVHFLYLFGKVCSARLSTRGIVVDEENLSYVEQALQKYKNARVIIGWGNSMSKSATAISAKKRILAMMDSREDNRLWQLGGKSLGITDNMHPLFMGIRYGNVKWELKPFEIPEELKATEEAKEPAETPTTGNVVVAKRVGKAKQAEKLRK